MTDYNYIIENVKDFKKFLLEMIDLLNHLKRKTKNKDLIIFYICNIFKEPREYKFYILKIALDF